MIDLEIRKNGALYVRDHRKRRRSAGLTEIKVWINKDDLYKVRQLLLPFVQSGENHLHLFFGGKYPKY